MSRLTGFFAALTRWSLSLCALVVVLAALYVSVARELTPLVAGYRVEVQSRAQAALGMPLGIGSLEGSWRGFSPVFIANDVMLGEGANTVRLDEVRAEPDLWASLLAWDLRLSHVQIEGLQVSVKEDQNGHWALEGLPVSNDKPIDPEQLLNQMQMVSRLSLSNSQVTLQPFGQAPLTLTYVNVSLATGSSRQRLDARLTLPDGQPLALNVRSRIEAKTWKDAEADVYLSLPQSDWAHWLPKSLTRQVNVSTLKAGGEFWLTWGKGNLQTAVARLNAPQIKAGYAARKAS